MAEGDEKSRLGKIGEEIFNAFLSNFSGSVIEQTILMMEQGATQIAKQFGQGRENIVALQAAMGDAVIKVREMGGDFADIRDIQSQITKDLGRNVIFQGDLYEQMYATTEVTGQSARELTKGFKDAGYSVYDITKQMQSVVDVARQQGVSAIAVSDKVLSNMSALNRFGFENGVQGLAKMAAQATALRIDMKTSLDMSDRLFDPEKAIDMAASLQRLGVTQSSLLDPLRLMDLAQNDPAELQNQLAEMSKQFVQLNKDGHFEIMPGARRQLREIASALGMNRDELEKMALSSAELETKMSKIVFPDFMSEEQQQMVANLAEIKDGKAVVTFENKEGVTETKAVTELTDDDLARLGEASKPKTLEDLTKEQLTVDKSIDATLKSIAGRTGVALAGTRMTEDTKQAAKSAYDVMAAGVGGEKLQNEQLRTALGTGMSDLLSSFTSGDFLGGITTAATNAGSYMTSAFTESTDLVSKKLNELAASTNPVIQAMVKIADFVAESEKLKSPSEPTVVNAKDFILKTLPEDEIKVVGGTNLTGGNGNTGNITPEKMTVDGNVTVSVNINAQGIDATTLANALKDQTVSNAIKEAVAGGFSNSNPNRVRAELKNREMNSYNFG